MFLLEMFQYGFMVRAMIAGLLVAIIAPAIGIFLVTRRYSFLADTLAHVSLAGVAAGSLFGWHPILTAMGTSVGSALLVESLRSTRRVLGEASLALLLSSGLAVSSILLSIGRGGAGTLQGILFGSITTVQATDVWLIVALGVVVLAVILLLYRFFLAIAHDEELAIASGLPVRALNVILMVLAAITVSLTMRIVGALLVSALMVIPVVSAMQLKRSFRATLFLSIAFALVAVLVGLTVSFHVGVPSGGTIVLTSLVFFIVTHVVRR